jgi:hypothetical protein
VTFWVAELEPVPGPELKKLLLPDQLTIRSNSLDLIFVREKFVQSIEANSIYPKLCAKKCENPVNFLLDWKSHNYFCIIHIVAKKLPFIIDHVHMCEMSMSCFAQWISDRYCCLVCKKTAFFIYPPH